METFSLSFLSLILHTFLQSNLYNIIIEPVQYNNRTYTKQQSNLYNNRTYTIIEPKQYNNRTYTTKQSKINHKEI